MAFNPAGPTGIAVLNQPIQKVLAAFEIPATPQTGANRVPDMPPAIASGAVDTLIRAGLLQPAGGAVSRAGQPSTLSAWLHITQACNLECSYCYVHKRPNAMSAAVGCRAVDRLVEAANRHGYTTLKLKYAGGEPTLNFPVIEAIHHRAVQKVERSGLELEEVVLTNGVGLSDAMLDSMAQAGTRLMVSLDGKVESHDRVRSRRDGRGSHAAAVDAVGRALARGLTPSISITVTALNLDGFRDAVAFALERGLPFNLNFYRECSPTGPADPGHTASLSSSLMPDPSRLTRTLLDVFSLIQAFPAYPRSLSGILDRTRLDVPHDHPCSAGRDYLVIDTEGRVSACQMLLEEPWADLAQEDPLSAVRRQGREVFKPMGEGSMCEACAWRAACGGGCPLIRETALRGRYCQVYQALFPELIRLEGNRLLTRQS